MSHYVINFELPNEPESYVHRIGRTARAGASGVAIAFCDPSERKYLRDIENLLKMSLTVVAVMGRKAKKRRLRNGRAGAAAKVAVAKAAVTAMATNPQTPAANPAAAAASGVAETLKGSLALSNQRPAGIVLTGAGSIR